MVDAFVKISGSIFVGGLGLLLFAIGIVIVLVIFDEFKKRR
jgi:hypothetical protein